MKKGEILERSMLPLVKRAGKAFPCVLLTGARQVGKSTLLQRFLPKGVKYVSLDDFATAAAAKADPAMFLETLGCPACIDEIQHAPELLRAIKARVDAARRPGMYFMSGSQRFGLMEGVTESLAGRIAVLELGTLSQRELTGKGAKVPPYRPEKPLDIMKDAPVCPMAELYKRIWNGGYPGLMCSRGMPRDLFFSSYLQTYIERDVSALTQVADKGAFQDMMYAMADLTGQQLVYSDLARNAGVSMPTVKRWVSILETSGIITLLRPYSTTTPKRLTKSPVLHFMDTGFCCWLAGIKTPQELSMHRKLNGHILESWVFGQLMRRYANCGDMPLMHFYREAKGAEIDLLIERAGTLYPIEVKRSLTPSASDLKAMHGIPLGSRKLAPGVVFCPIQAPLPLGDKNLALPISAI
ncbi:MAG: DUF4143 domain-containing protein [Akkermansia sp.]|nr:DUF4143 domain-containing protein [Akkermansia sp.]